LEELGVRMDKPWVKLSERHRKAILEGTGERTYHVDWNSKSGSGSFDVKWEGLIQRLMRRFKSTQSERAKSWYAQFMGNRRCSTCAGSRLRGESAHVFVGDHSLVELSAMTVSEARQFFLWKRRPQGLDTGGARE
jgi:excinuclease ABC subunit A